MTEDFKGVRAMNTKLKQIVSGLAIVLAVATAISAQQNPAKASQVRVIKFHGDMATLLATLAQQYDVTIGMEADPKKPRSEVTLDLYDATFHDMLNGIVQSEPRYQWRESGGCIEVLPVSNGLSLMDIPIGSFQIKDVSREEAINELLNLPEVRAITMSMNLSRRATGNPPAGAGERKVSLNMNEVTLREALNRIIKQSGASFWLFRTYPDGTFSIGTSTY
jgi:hypothetical protein